MAAEMEVLKRQIKGNGVARKGNHSEHTLPRRSGSCRQDRTLSLSVTRSYGVGDSDPQVGRSYTRDSSYCPSRPSMMSRCSYSARSGDLRDVLEERARHRET
ncbi:hypothetical protein CsSME_00020023 [Camellia sinensis var. sinensis]